MPSKEFWENYKWKRHLLFVFMHPFPVQVQCCTKRRFSQFANCNVRQWGRRHTASSMQQTGIGWFSLGPTVWCIWEELDCNCSFVKEWKKQPKRLVPLEELQSCLAMKRIKDYPRKPNCQASRLHRYLLYDLPPHTTDSGWKNNKLKRRKSKQKSKASRRGETARKRSHWEEEKKSVIEKQEVMSGLKLQTNFWLMTQPSCRIPRFLLVTQYCNQSSIPHDWNQDKAKTSQEVLEKQRQISCIKKRTLLEKASALSPPTRKKNGELIQLQIFSFVPSWCWCSVENVKDWYNRKTTERYCSVSDFIVLLLVDTCYFVENV